jgi:hypothetical protein
MLLERVQELLMGCSGEASCLPPTLLCNGGWIWFREWFKPVLDRIEIRAMSWEDLINAVQQRARDAGRELHGFYDRCLQYGPPKAKAR